MNKEKSAKLILKDGSIYSGYSFGFEKNINGEVVFNTGMVGYEESLTDPSYQGQILVCTYPLIGNYGVGPKKFWESNGIKVRALIVSSYINDYSHWLAERSLHQWLKKEKIPAIYGIDTRALTKKLRTEGVMLGKVVIDENKTISFADPNIENLVAQVSVKKPITYGNARKKIIVIDCGLKKNILNNLLNRNIKIKRVPWDYDFNQEKFDAILISNGPGDPTKCKETIYNVKQALKKRKPIFGICLGSQIMALASGAKTYKLKYGHRGQNQPCLELGTKKCYLTTQNHGFAIAERTLPKEWKPWFINANDKTNEGIKHKNRPFSAVQFHPEANPGPLDTQFLFDEFIHSIK
jgi:carbamoyl-phosphate synthase small subunit